MARTKKTASKSKRLPLSGKQKVERQYIGDIYVSDIDDISDDEVWRRILETGNVKLDNGGGLRFSCDSASGCATRSECEYNGPIPLGFRDIPPSHLPLQGIVGKVLKHFAARNFFLGDQINGWFMMNCFVYKACSMPGDDAVAAGYEFKPRDKGKAAKDLMQEMVDFLRSEEVNIDETLRTFETHKRGYGGVIMVPCFEEDVDMSMPLVDFGQLKGKTFLGWTCIDPYYITPTFEPGSRSITDVTYKRYMEPDYWTTTGVGSAPKKIHHSWVFFRRNIVTSRIYRPMYKFLGPSIPQMIVERLYSAEVCANESSMLMRSKRSFVMEADLRKWIQNPQGFAKFLKNCQKNSDNYGIKVLPEGSNPKQMDSYLTECMPLTLAQYGILCAEIEIPAPKFMMAQLTGFANSGNYETKLYAQNVKKLLTNDIAPILKRTAEFYTACKTGEAKKYDITFGEVDIPTVTEKAEIMYEAARAAKFTAEADAVKKMAAAKSAEGHKSVAEREGIK